MNLLIAPTYRRNIAKGLLCGLLGGVAGSVAKIAGELVYDPRNQGQTPPPVVLERKLVGHPMTHAQEQTGMQVIHFIFGAGTGAIYGVAAEFAPIVTAGYGSAFGFVLQFFTHESLVPLAGLDVPPWKQPAREHTSEFFTHILYGVATEAVRRYLRKKMA